MKIGILTHFDSFQDSYALHVGWLERAKLLSYFNQDFDFLVSKRCPPNIYPHSKSILKPTPPKMTFEEKVNLHCEEYKKILKCYDAILTADLLYQRKGNFLAYNQAMRNAAPYLKAHWYHWIHSSWVQRPDDIEYPESLRFEYMPNSTLVYLNSVELPGLASMYGVGMDKVACVYNPKDFRSFNDFHVMAWEITYLLDIQNKDIVQLFPCCATRMNAKGVDTLFKVFGTLKRKGVKVALIMAVGNSRKGAEDIEAKKELMKQEGLIEGEDFLWTHELHYCFRTLPRKAVSDLFKVSNLFVFPSWRETTANVLQEAKINGNLLVLNRRIPCFREMNGLEAIWFDGTRKTPGISDYQTGDMQIAEYDNENGFYDLMTEMILKRVPSRKHLWQWSYDWIWENQFKPLLYGNNNAS